MCIVRLGIDGEKFSTYQCSYNSQSVSVMRPDGSELHNGLLTTAALLSYTL